MRFRCTAGDDAQAAAQEYKGESGVASRDILRLQLQLTAEQFAPFQNAAMDWQQQLSSTQARIDSIAQADRALHANARTLSAQAKAAIRVLLAGLPKQEALDIDSIHRDSDALSAQKLDEAVMNLYQDALANSRLPRSTRRELPRIGSGVSEAAGSGLSAITPQYSNPGGVACADETPEEEQDAEDTCEDQDGIYSLETCTCTIGPYPGGGGTGPTIDPSPVVTGVAPAVIDAGNKTSIIVSGQNFGTNPPTVSFSPSAGIEPTVTSYSDTQIGVSVYVTPSTPTEELTVNVTSNGYGGSAFYGGGVNSPTGSGDNLLEVLDTPGNLYVVDPYIPPLSGSNNLSTSSILSAISSNYSGTGGVAAYGMITDGTATAVAIYANAVGSSVSFTGTGGITFATWSNSFLQSAPSTGTSSCPSDSCSVTQVQQDGVYYSFVLVQAPRQSSSVPYGKDTATVAAGISSENTNEVELSLGPTPVIFVHGLWGNASSLNTILSTLAAQAPWGSANATYKALTSPCYSVYLPFDAIKDSLAGNGTGCESASQTVLTNQASVIQDSLNGLGYVGGRFDLVVHSMGGLVARHYSTLPAFTTTNSRMQGLFRTVVTIDTPENGSMLAPYLLQANVAGGTCSQSQLCQIDGPGSDTTPVRVWDFVCGNGVTLATCLGDKSLPLGPPGTGPGGFNTSACSVASPATPSCGAVASLAPNGPNIAALPSASIPGSSWVAIGADWQDTASAQTSELRALLNNLLAAMSISSPVPTLSCVLGASSVGGVINGACNSANTGIIDNDVIVTTSSQFWNSAGVQTVEFPNLAHSPMPDLLNIGSYVSGTVNNSVTTSTAVANCVATILLSLSTSGCAGGQIGMGPLAAAIASPDALQQSESATTFPRETPEEREARMKHRLSFSPERLSAKAPEGNAPLGSPIEIGLIFAPGKVAYLDVLQHNQRGAIPQSQNSFKVVREEGRQMTIEIIPVQTGDVDLQIEAIYSDNAVVRQTVHLKVVASSKGLNKFYLNQGPGGMPLVLEDKEEDRQMWMRPVVIYDGVKFPIYLDDSAQIKLSVEQDEGDPVIRVDKNGMVHALREGKAVIVGDFDGVIDRVPVTVYSKENAPVGYRRVSD
jgi:pimeloyl-ACP methyl ester carboxylesterase